MNPVAALLAASVPVLVGVLVLVRAQQRLIGWLLIAHGLCIGGLLTHSGTSTSNAGMVADQLGAGSWVFLFLWLVLIAYLVPDGHVASPRWRSWVRLGLVGVLAFLVGAAGDASGFRAEHAGVEPPLPWLPTTVSGLLGVAGLVVTVAFFFGAGFAVRSRLQSAVGDARLQLMWLVWGATSVPAALVLAWIGHFVFGDDPRIVDGALILAAVALPITIGIAILRYRLFDIQVVLSRTLTYGLLVVAVGALYGLMLLGANRLVGDSAGGGLLAVGIVAVAVHPGYSFLRTRVERWVYGYRSDPAAAMRRLGADVEFADPLEVVDTLTASVADALKVAHVWVEDPAAAHQDRPGVVRVPLLHRGEHLGDLALEVPPGRTISARDSALLRDLARQAAVTVRVAQLAVELQASREQLVSAREEERKRLRRDLHDGLGPSLAAVVLKLRAAQGHRADGERNALLDEIRAETQAAISEVRRLVDGLRPPAVDEVGLTEALRQRAASLSSEHLVYEVRAVGELPPLPAAVEVAAFRIASEAMTNVARHSGASRCLVELTVDDALVLEVSDNGGGSAAPPRDGVGRTSMAERAAELGGSCRIVPRPGGGLVVRATLPLPVAADREAVR